MNTVRSLNMDSVRSLILSRGHELGLNLAELSRRVGRNHAYFHQFVYRGVPLNLPEEIRYALAPILGVDERELRPLQLKRKTAPSQAAPSNARITGSAGITGTIPVYGHAVGGKDGCFILNGNKVADVLAPPSLAKVPEAYAVYVVGDSMVPRYFAGEVVYVNPRLPVRQGDFVVAQIASDGEGGAPHAFIKRFVSMDSKVLRLTQLNPKKRLEFPRAKVVSVHRIVMGGEG